MAVTGDFKKAFLQVRVAPEERNALIFHCLKNLDTRIQNTNNQTFAKQQLGLTEVGSGTIIGLRWDKQRDIVSIAVPSEKVESTNRVY